VASTLLLVATGNVDHGGSVESRTRTGADTNADAGATYRLRGAGVTSNGSSVTSRCGGCCGRVLLIRGGAVETRTRLDWQAGVDHGHQSTDGRLWVAVEVADGSVQIKLELVYHVGRNVSLRKSGHVAELVGGVVWHESLHLDVLSIDAQTEGNTLG
jgi:hypothetical protein